MAAAKRPTDPLAGLPPVRGRLTADAPLAGITWFRVGGTAEIMFRPADRDDLAAFLAGKPQGLPVTVIGVGSNLLVRDGGVPGVVIRLGREFARIETEDDRIRAGAGALDLNVAIAARDAGLAGLEFLSGIPGTIGGALRMNGGAYGREMTDVVIEGEALDGGGGLHRLAHRDFGFSYRHCDLPEDWIFTGALLQGRRDEPAAIQARMAEIQKTREESQPIRTRTGGSTFANPAGPEARGRKAWQLIDEAGCRGLRIGGAQVSERHCNFLINTGDATAADIETLGEDVRRRVKEKTGVTLEWEIRRIGRPATSGPEVRA
ncbi:MAG TPA: UDP-N-acetylmuramate dehydrogenase [Hypericibacter adhaerens]|nr:UDP-N-acetylmuramate dehydrogenase [Hypericibacter adhaerens]HWA43407.1 UDP-N-acetylmuramate dehydrogenase [Hypericibacter adhaerens]